MEKTNLLNSTEVIQDMKATLKGKSWVYLTISAILFTLVIIASIYLYVSNLNLWRSIEKAKTDIVGFQDQITKLEDNSEIVAYNTVKSAMPEIEKNILASQAYIYIDELKLISKKYSLDFSGFSYQDWKISTSAVASLTKEKDAVEKISRFIKDYRDENKNMFVLNPVSNISWDYLKRSFEISFNLSK
ncbi:MAG: hypothetical protein ACD_49C00026G0023 [uncultured bacterium (gcode 4)]|uniref:Uncharacterized protein n=1 Tax=uncultured bacterium (gcode 4) TaxID=1234023 RepID=K2BD48_9BACT|nr:MAG: hypothetical protein ACD_49C00026G0023 [uncultured bacterium (gcode 4)]